MYLYFKITSPVPGNCTVIIKQSPDGAEGTYELLKQLSVEKGDQEIPLGIATSEKNYFYSVEAIDGYGKRTTNSLYFKQFSGNITLSYDFDSNDIQTKDSTIKIQPKLTYKNTELSKKVTLTINTHEETQT